MTFDAHQLAGKAHYQIVRDIIDVQARILQRKALIAEFGADAIEPMTMIIGRRSVTEAAETMKRADDHDRERLAELLATARAMEEIFKTKHDADMADFATYWKERFKSGAS